MSANVIQEYLVSLGFAVNTPAFNQFNQTMSLAQKTVETATGGMARSFVSASATIVTAIGAVNSATAGLLHTVAEADMGYQKLALRMWMSKQSAKELKTTLDALGESLEDAAFIPELRGQFQALLGQGRSMALPQAEYAQQMKDIRSIGFEFKRMKLEATYAMEWIGYYLVKHLAGPLGSVKKQLKDINDWITKTMPIWTEKVASFLASMVSLGQTLWRTMKNTWEVFESVWASIPKGTQVALAAFAVLGAAIISGPFGMALLTIGALLVLLEDFFYFLDGKESSETMKPFWKWLTQFMKDMSESGPIKKLKQDFKDLWTAIDELRMEIVRFLTPGSGAGDQMRSWAKDMAEFIGDCVRGITFLIEAFTHLMRGDFMEWFSKKFSDKRDEAKRTNPGGLDSWGKKYPMGPPNSGWGWWKDTAPNSGGGGGGGASLGVGGAGISSIDIFMEALAQKEGNGRYDQPEHWDAGYWNLGGRYQILADNWPGWAQEAGLSANAPYSAENQEKVARYKVQQYFSTYGSWAAVAAAWNGGPDGAESWLTYGKDSYMWKNGYVPDVMQNFSNLGGSGGGNSVAGVGGSLGAGGGIAPGATNIATVNNINVSAPPGADAHSWAAAIAKALEPYQGMAQVRVVHQMREMQGVQA